MATGCVGTEPVLYRGPELRSSATSVAVIVPTYDERDNLGELHSRLRQLPEAHTLLIVDDGSPDGTGDLAERLSSEDPRVHVLHRAAKSGYASALREGMAWALGHGARTVITMDADLSHDPAAIPPLLAALQAADVAVGSRYVSGGRTEHWPWTRELLSRLGNRFIRALLGPAVRDWTGGFRAYRADAVLQAQLLETASAGYAFGMEALYRCVLSGLRVVEVPIIFSDRRAGRSKLSFAIMRESLRRAVRLRAGRRELQQQLPTTVDPAS